MSVWDLQLHTHWVTSSRPVCDIWMFAAKGVVTCMYVHMYCNMSRYMYL